MYIYTVCHNLFKRIYSPTCISSPLNAKEPENVAFMSRVALLKIICSIH